MRAIDRHIEEQVGKAKKIFLQNLEKVCPHLKRKFVVTQNDSDVISFGIDGYPFSLTWGEEVKEIFGREIPVPTYQLSIWHTEGGGRWHPPETVDTELVNTKSIHECITCALETVAKDEIRQCLEGVGYEIMEENQEEW